MKFVPSFVHGAITTPDEEIAVLEAVEGGQCRYAVSYKANPFVCAREKAFLVKIHIADKPYASKVQSSFNSTAASNEAENTQSSKATTPEKTLELIQTRSSRIKDSIRGAKTTNYLLTFTSDITSRLPNDLAYLLGNKTIASSGGVPLKQKKTFRVIDTAELSARQLSSPTLEKFTSPGLGSAPTAMNAAKVDSRHVGLDLLYKHGIDPAAAFMKENAISMAPVSHGGIKKKDPTSNSSITQQQFVNSFVRADNTITTQGTATTLRVVPVTDSETSITVTELFNIPIDVVGTADFFLVFELINSAGIVIEKLIRTVEHHKLLSIVQAPTIEPTVYAMPSSKPGKVALELLQNDPVGIGVAIYRKTWYPNKTLSPTPYALIGKQSLLYGEKVLVEDDVSNINPVVYRVVPYGRDEALSSVFGSALTRAKDIEIKQRKKQIRSSFVSFSYNNTSEGVEVTIKDIPAGVVSVEVFKKDHKKSTNVLELVDTPSFIGSDKASSIRVIDASVEQGRTYEYTCRLVYKDGSRVYSNTTLLVEYVLETAGFLATTVKNTKVIKGNGFGFDCTFELETYFLEKDESLIRRSLEKAGALSYFQGDITRDKLQLATAYRFLRTNLTTGDVEDLGVGTDTTFRDSAYSSVKGAKQIEAGYEYQYKILTHFRAPESIVQGATNNVLRQKVLQADGLFFDDYDYSYEPFRWRHPVNLQDGTLSSPSSLRKNHAKSDFTFGQIGSATETTITLQDVLPSVLDAKVYKVNSRINKIEWKLTGAAASVDHFIVVLEVGEMRSVVGKTHNISDTNLFSFIDYLDNGEKGVLSYVIIPVHYDFSKGRETKTNYVVV